MSSASTDSFVQAFTHLKGRPKEERALPMLQRIASLVKPIMRKHGWVYALQFEGWNLPLLAEFFPANDNLIGLSKHVNGGQKILLRLRPARAPDTFYEEEEVVQTMLHELTHNVHGPHDEKFYKFLSGLQDEYDALQRSGYSGEGFFSNGNRVALEAAEKRRKTQLAIGNGGGRLGGRTDTANLTPRELAARVRPQTAARETRKRVDPDSSPSRRRTRRPKKASSIKPSTSPWTRTRTDSDVIVVDAPGPSKVAIPQSKKVAVSTCGSSDTPRCQISGERYYQTSSRQVLTRTSRSRPQPPAKKSRTDWTCRTCTLINPLMALQCDACLAQRPPDDSIGWACLTCGETGMPHDHWTCRTCGTVKPTS
ncbi:WLM domain-containing protein [Mycena metata]|uniref:WLM domain-containing protein n=1 Tax=Mycena metata TaxID=1033252 RepID=A0AAD7J7P8_9AGAR|nr:WLM domain-containing protein [Mycena metata]